MGLNYFFGQVGWGGWSVLGGWVVCVKKLILKLISPLTGVGVEARAELGNDNDNNNQTIGL